MRRFVTRWGSALVALPMVRASTEFEAIYTNMNFDDNEFRSIQPRHMAVDLLPFQKRGVGWLIDRELKTSGGIMSDHLGMGKTVQMLGLCVEAPYHAATKGEVQPKLSKTQVEAEAYRLITVIRQLQQIPAVGNCSKITTPGKDLFRLITDIEAAVGRGDQDFSAFRTDVDPWLRFAGRYFPNFEKRARTFLDTPSAQSFDDVQTDELRTLIVVPAALMHQWQAEIKAKINHSHRKYTVLVHHTKSNLDSADNMAVASLESCDFVLTTYEMLVRGAAPGWSCGLQGVSAATPTSSFDRSKAAALFRVRWKRIILDEAHVVRNPMTSRWKAVELLDGVKRWAVTATPLHNSILDLQTLMKFTGNAILPIHSTASASAANEFVIRDRTLQRSVARALMPAMLRRAPVQKRNGVEEVLVKLPEKTESIVRLNFTDGEAQLYNDILARSRSQLANARKDSAVHVFAMMIRLRQACLHPMLHQGKVLEVYLCGICRNQASDPILTKCGHAFCYDCLGSKFEEQSALEQAVRIPCPECEHPVSQAVFKKVVSSASRLQQLRQRAPAFSTKVDAIMQKVQDIRTTYPDDKIVIFSQFTGMLDVLTISLEKVNITPARLDGSMNLDSRASVIKQFQTVPTVNVLLASKFAVGVGLNLTAANHVLVTDPWWNPAVEEQAVHRCHRIGQTKPVFVTRFAISDSIEDYCLGISLKKKKFGDAVLSAVSDADFASTSSMLSDVQKLSFLGGKKSV